MICDKCKKPCNHTFPTTDGKQICLDCKYKKNEVKTPNDL